MIMRWKTTIKTMYVFGENFPNTSQTPKKLLSCMKLSRVGRKSETDKFFSGLTPDA